MRYIPDQILQSGVSEQFTSIKFLFPYINPGNLRLSIQKKNKKLNLGHCLMVLALGLVVEVSLRLECLCMVSLMR